MSTSLRCQVRARTQRRFTIWGRLHQLLPALLIFRGTAAQAKLFYKLNQEFRAEISEGQRTSPPQMFCLEFQDCLAKGGRAAICVRRKTGRDEYHRRELHCRRKSNLWGSHNMIDHCDLLAGLGGRAAVHRAASGSAAYRITLISKHHISFMMMPWHSVAMMMRNGLRTTMAGCVFAAFHAGLRQQRRHQREEKRHCRRDGNQTPHIRSVTIRLVYCKKQENSNSATSYWLLAASFDYEYLRLLDLS